jgi:hypothetical protein
MKNKIKLNPNEIKLNPKQQDIMRVLDLNLTKKKCLIVDLEIKSKNIQSQINVLLNETILMEEEILKKAQEIALELKIDLEGPNHGQWNLDTTKMVFIKI